MKKAVTKKSSPAATKADLAKVEVVIKADLTRLETSIEGKLENVAMKSDLEKFALKTDLAKFALKTDLVEMESRLIDQMLLLNEQQLSNFRDIFADRTAQQNDRIDDHEHRIQRIEHKVMAA